MSVSFRGLYAIVNPKAALGRARRFWRKLKEQLRDRIGPFPWDCSRAPEHASTLARNALERGHEHIVSIGGDGTHNEVVNGFFADGRSLNPRAMLIPISCGSGNDFGRSINADARIKSAMKTILSGREREVDLGHLEFLLPSGATGKRLFLNVASLGLSARIAGHMRAQPYFLGGPGRFLLATARALIAHQGEEITLQIDGKKLPHHRVNTIVAANGQFFGGGMRVAPHARLDDGLLDVVVIGEVGLGDLVLWGPRLYRGKHLSHPLIQSWKARRISAVSRTPVPLEADGEILGTLPAIFTVLPQAVRVLASR